MLLHMTEFPSKLTGEWMDGIYCHTLVSLRGPFNNFGTLGAKSSPHG
jgi:hypothetical protein